jgi:ParB family chromosome partitioning protein
MKRAPIIVKPKTTSMTVSSSDVPAAPMVDSLIARVGTMAKGNTISLPVCGREVRFVLQTLEGENIADKTTVWPGNERDQELLNKDSLDDLIHSFLLVGQQIPAYGRMKDGVIEVADGSRRRMTAMLISSEYRILVGKLDDAQMESLCKTGNDYRPTSAYERGKRYALRLAEEFNGNISALSDAENISRKIITRCINTSKLPRDVIVLFSHPGELSGRAGELLHKNFEGKEELLLSQAFSLAEKKKAGVLFESSELVELINEVLKPDHKGSPKIEKKQYAPGISSQCKGNKFIITLDRSKLHDEIIEKIESLLVKIHK